MNFKNFKDDCSEDHQNYYNLSDSKEVKSKQTFAVRGNIDSHKDLKRKCDKLNKIRIDGALRQGEIESGDGK